MARPISLDAIMNAIKDKVTGRFDLVVGIECGGILPAYLASKWLDVPLTGIHISFRDSDHHPIFPEPRLIHGMNKDMTDLQVLLIDDIVNTGATLNRAAKELAGATITTMVIAGEADISLFGTHRECIQWPWSRE